MTTLIPALRQPDDTHHRYKHTGQLNDRTSEAETYATSKQSLTNRPQVVINNKWMNGYWKTGVKSTQKLHRPCCAMTPNNVCRINYRCIQEKKQSINMQRANTLITTKLIVTFAMKIQLTCSSENKTINLSSEATTISAEFYQLKD